MIQSPPRRPPSAAPVVIIGFLAGLVAEFVIDLVLDYTLTLTSLAATDAVGLAVSIVLGALVGGVTFLGRPRHYGVAAIVAGSAVVSGIIADEIATPVYFTLRHFPVEPSLLTNYFTHARPMFWIANLVCAAVAAGLTALRVRLVRAAAVPPPGTGTPPGPWTPAEGRGPWSPPPQRHPYGPTPQSPYGPPQGPYGPPSR